MKDPQVTLLVVPRERFGLTQRSLEDIYRQTEHPFRLIYVDAGSPAPVRCYLDRAAKERNFELLRVDRYLSPNQARNLALRRAKTKYVVFLDNDVLLTSGWLTTLIRCAEETGAWVVGPLYLEGELQHETIHMAGGFTHVTELDGQRIFDDEHHFAGATLSELPGPLERIPCDYVEFHCALVRREVFERLGLLDEQLLSVHEHIDFGLRVRQAGGAIYFEPGAVISYVPPPPCDWRDLPFYMLRWSDAWNRATIAHFKQKWGYSMLRYFDDPQGPGGEDTIARWARGHRRRMTGLSVSGDGDDRPESPLEAAECMVALFLSVDHDAFELVLADDMEQPVETAGGLGPQDVLERLPKMLARAEEEHLYLLIRPLSPPDKHPVVLLRLDSLDNERTSQPVRPHAFLVLESGPGTYQCWLAVARGDPPSAGAWRRLGVAAQTGVAEPVPVAGSRMADTQAKAANGAGRRVRLVEGRAGLLNSLVKLEEKGLFPLLRCSFVV